MLIQPFLPAKLRRSILLFLVMVSTGLGLFLVIFPAPDLSQELELLKRIALLSARMEHAEHVNTQRRAELLELQSHFSQIIQTILRDKGPEYAQAVLDQLESGSPAHAFPQLSALARGANWTYDLSLPGIHQYLPHVVKSDKSFRPAFKLAGKRPRNDVSLVFGIPTVKREHQSYLSVTLKSMFDSLGTKDERDCLIIVLVAETDIEFVQTVAAELQHQFPEHVESGLLEVISPPPEFYPDFGGLRATLGDDPNRVQWRSKQNLDYSFLMMYAQSRGVYYIQLEDDILTKPGFSTKIKEFALEKTLAKEPWFVIDYCQLGFIGKLFRSSDLPILVDFFLMFYNDKPGDWLLEHLIHTRVCKLDADQKQCKKEKAHLWKHYKPSLFQHIGTHSSLKGKVQKLKDKQFGRISMFTPHRNPAAKIDTVIKHYKAYSLTRAYNGETFYWGLAPQDGDNIVINLTPPVKLSGFKFVSGNAEHPSDRFVDTSIEIYLPDGSPSGLTRTEDGFCVVGSFAPDGLAQGEIDPEWGVVSHLRLSIHTSSDNWVILSEILLKVA